MIYFILPKQPTNLQVNLRIVQLAKRQARDRKVVGSILAQANGFFGFFFLFPKKKYVRTFSQPETTNQPVTIFSTGRSIFFQDPWPNPPKMDAPYCQKREEKVINYQLLTTNY